MADKLNALVVDDNDIITKQMRNYLQKKEIAQKIWCANNGKEACELIEKHKPNLVLVNLQMPDMSGFEVIEKYSSTDIKFIIVSGFVDIEAIQKAHELNVASIINKPFNYESFELKINEALKHKPHKNIQPIQYNIQRKRSFWERLFK